MNVLLPQLSMGEQFETGYQALGPYYDEDQEGPPTDNIVHVVPDSSRARWNHIEDLDEFFTRVYEYHQRSGFIVMVLQDVLQLLQFLFVVLFSAFLIKCVDYEVLFYEKSYNGTHKVTIPEAVYPLDQCIQRFDTALVVCVIIALVFWLFRFLKFVYMLFKYVEIRAFYTQALKVAPSDLANMTWHEVQRRVLEVQLEQQMCIHKQELSELDIYHRILRFKNYMVAMVNKSLLPLKHRLPLLGDHVFLTTGLKYNLEMMLFWGPWSPFENNWHLKADYRNFHKRKEIADYLSRRLLWIGIANLVMSPLIFLWQILFLFFRYATVIKREPGVLGSRTWSLYARLYLRHFNELDHEFYARMNRAYKPAEKYMNIFTSPILVILAKHTAFFAGSMLAVFVILTVIDEDVLAVQNVIGTMTILGLIVTICGVLIPDEHLVWCPEMLMRRILGEIHYMPDSWKGQAHTAKVRAQFSELFQYKVVYLMEELFSPLTTPIMLFFVRHKTPDIVDFFRNFTVEVTGVGDVCSFAQMDIRKHGNPQWMAEECQANQYQQAEDGKTELSLVHFTLTNPAWRPPQVENMFINHLKEQAQRDATSMSVMPADNPLYCSLHSMSSTGYPGYNSMISSVIAQGRIPPLQAPPQFSEHTLGGADVPQRSAGASSPSAAGLSASISLTSNARLTAVRGGVRNSEGPLGGSTNGILSSLHQGMQPMAADGGAYPSLTPLPHPGQPFPSLRQVDEGTVELLSAEMSISALYMHELHHRRKNQPYFETFSPDSDDGIELPNMPLPPQPMAHWTADSAAAKDRDAASAVAAAAAGVAATATGVTLRMSNIQETSDEELANETAPLLLDVSSTAPDSTNQHSTVS